jgi:cold shock CspA family protein
MHTGRVTKINSEGGFCFLINTQSNKTTFCHVSGCVTPFDTLQDGDAVEYEVRKSTRNGKPEAWGVKLVLA